MIDKDPSATSDLATYLKEALPYLTTVLLAAWGGTVSYIEDLRKSKKKFSFGDWVYRIITSGFVGVLTYWLCMASGMEFGPLSAFCIAVSGHMGVEAMRMFVKLRNRMLGVEEVDKQPEN